jgi:hypothetical protein
MPGETICLDRDVWTEVPDRTIIKAGTVYVGKDFIPDSKGNPMYEIRAFVRKIGSEFEAPNGLKDAYEYVKECSQVLTGVVDIDLKAAWWIISVYGLDIRSRVSPEAVSEMIVNLIDLNTLTTEDGVIIECKSHSTE